MRPPAGDYYIRKAGTDANEHLIVCPETGFLQVDSTRRDQFRLEYNDDDSTLSFFVYRKNQSIGILNFSEELKEWPFGVGSDDSRPRDSGFQFVSVLDHDHILFKSKSFNCYLQQICEQNNIIVKGVDRETSLKIQFVKA